MKNAKIYIIIIALAIGLLLGGLKGENTSVRGGDGLLSLFPESVQEFLNRNIIGPWCFINKNKSTSYYYDRIEK